MNRNKFRGALVALACGDALGANYEFIPRNEMPSVKENFLNSERFPTGCWTDDTSQALCLATSLLENGFDLKDQMDRYLKWYDTGYLSSVEGKCLDVGLQTCTALDNYRSNPDDPVQGPTGESHGGNGSIMRLLPVVLYFYPDRSAAIHYAELSSITTHGSEECKQSCKLMAEFLCNLLDGLPLRKSFISFSSFTEPKVAKLTNPDYYSSKSLSDISSRGYVISTLEASLYCLLKTSSLKEAIMKAVSLGNDTDTVAAVTGQLAGAYYGYSSIPDIWLRDIKSLPFLLEVADRLYDKKAGEIKSR